ncbi:MAG: hypothetical protein LLG04_14405 [Parachlamydia sp.]|nr:hypothetical protein [Parachlamydia sp.]
MKALLLFFVLCSGTLHAKELSSAAPAEKFSREKSISVIFFCRPASTTPTGLPASVVKKISTDLDFSERIFPTGAAELSFESLAEAAYPQEVTVRGFLYRTQAGDLVLTGEPNLKSCCVGGAHKVEKQIYVEGDIESPKSGQVYLLQGVFTVAPKKDSAGHLTRLYLLRDARVIPSQENVSKWAAAVSIIILIAVCLVFRKVSFLK